MTDRTISLPLSRIPENHVVGGRYRVGALIGRGATGAVYEGEIIESGRSVALKRLLDDLPDGAQIEERFRREALAGRLIDHPHIVEVLDLVAADNTLYLVMELVRGVSIATLIERSELSARRSLVLVRQVLAGLAHAHASGVIHRDLKPENLMVSRVGDPGNEYDHVTILDFGLVKLVGDAAVLAGGSVLTHTGMVFGTPTYMAPEQTSGRPVDARVDLYAAGVVLFEMLSGRPPYRSADDVAVMRMHTSAPIPTLAQLNPGKSWCTPELEALVRGALAKEPTDRFASAEAMTEALDAAFLSLDR